MADAKVVISVRDGVFEFSGPVDFVEKQLEVYKEQIAKAMAAAPKQSHFVGGGGDKRNDGNGAGGTTVPDGLEGLLTVDEDGKIHISAVIEGSTNAAKHVKIVQLAGLAQPAGVSFSKLHQICKDHGCYDSSNFSANIKAEKGLFVISGKGKNLSAKLTPTGITRAKELAAQIHSGS